MTTARSQSRYTPNEYIKKWMASIQDRSATFEVRPAQTNPVETESRSKGGISYRKPDYQRSKRARLNPSPNPVRSKPQLAALFPDGSTPFHQSTSRQAAEPLEDEPSEAHVRLAVEGATRGRSLEERRESANLEIRQSSASRSSRLSYVGYVTQVDIRPTLSEEHDSSTKYARRRRHKIKDDKYDYKGDRMENKRSGREEKYRKERNPRIKRGAILNAEFKAPNIEKERLTLKKDAGPGIFNKGRSSGPVELRGLPDLTFSEMTFLNKRRQLDDIRFRALQEQAAPIRTRKRSAQDVSEFFAHPSQDQERTPQRTQNKHSRRKSPQRFNSETRSPNAKLDSRETSVPNNGTFLAHRYVKGDSSAIAGHEWGPDVITPEFQHCEPAEGRDNPLHGSLAARNQKKKDGSRFSASVHPQSSVSNSAVDDYTQYILLGETLPRWQQARPQSGPSRYYSLKVLKDLAYKSMQQDHDILNNSYTHSTANKPASKPISSQDSSFSKLLQNHQTQSTFPDTKILGNLDDNIQRAAHGEHRCSATRKAPLGRQIPTGKRETFRESIPMAFERSKAPIPPTHAFFRNPSRYQLRDQPVELGSRPDDSKDWPQIPKQDQHQPWLQKSPSGFADAKSEVKPEVEYKVDHVTCEGNDVGYLEHFANLESLPTIPGISHDQVDVTNQPEGPIAEFEDLDAFDAALLRSPPARLDITTGSVLADQAQRLPLHALQEIECRQPPSLDDGDELVIGPRRISEMELPQTAELLVIAGDRGLEGRPQLLRPSADEVLRAEPFLGFSRPWLLY